MERKTAPLTPPQDADFFVSGGTMPESALSYVERAADRQLLDALLDGKFCYVLNSRQMGKSSLCVRVKTLLEAKGVACAFVDLTRIGGQNLSAEQWYAGILGEIGRSIGLRTEFLVYWREHVHESPMQRVFGALREVALVKKDGLVAVFIDEVDAARSLPFNADEFLTGIRECYNRRAHDPIYDRLTFCLLGAAVPSDLIRDARTTPFNIGERIYLKDFTRDEATVLAKGLGKGRERLLDRIFFWTNGHPFLTQSLCTAVEHDAKILTDEGVDALVKRDLLEPKARETNINLADVSNRVLNGYADGDDVDKFRANILSAYEKALKGRVALQDDESNRITAVLKLSGLMRTEGKVLKVRNPIYERVFGKEWINENMPGQEVRRQKRAFLLGVLRTSVVAGIIVAVIATLALRVDQLYHEANRERDRANYEVYVADMNLMPDLWKRGDIERMRILLASTANNTARGLEWSLWNRLAHLSSEELPDASVFALSPDGNQLIIRSKSDMKLVDAHSLKVLKTYPSTGFQNSMSFSPDGTRIIANEAEKGTFVYDKESGKQLGVIKDSFILTGSRSLAPDGTWGIGTDGNGLPIKIDLVNFKTSPIADQTTGIRSRKLSPSGKYSIWVENYSTAPKRSLGISIRETGTWKEIARIKKTDVGILAITPDDKHAIVGGQYGTIDYWQMQPLKLMWQIKPFADRVQRAELTPDGKMLATVGRERFAKVFNISDKGATLVRTFPDAGNIMISPTKDRVYIGYWTLRAYDLPGQEFVRSVRFPFIAAGFAMHPNGLVEARKNGSSTTYQMNLLGDQAPSLLWDGHTQFQGTSDKHNWMVVSDKNNKGYDVLDQNSKAFIGHLPIDVKYFFPLTDFPTSKKMVISNQHALQTWDIASNKLSMLYDAKDEFINVATISPDERTLAVGFSEGDVLLKDLHTGAVRRIKDHLAIIWWITFSRDGTKVATAADDDTASMIDVKAGVVERKFTGHAQTVNDIDFSPDGTRVVTGSDDRTARIWDTKTGRELTLLEADGEVNSVNFLNDGKVVAVATGAGAINLWSTDNTWRQK